MSNKSKFISTSTTILIVTSAVLGANGSKALANPFSNLWQRLKTASISLTLVNPFKTSNSNSNKLNKPSSNATLSNNSKTSKSLCSKLKSFFNKKSSKNSYNITTEDDANANTTVHTLKGDDNKPASKSKQKRERLAAAYDNDTKNLTSGEGSSSNDSNNINSIKQPESKNKPKSNNPSVSFEELTISLADSSSKSETNANSKKNSDLISDLKSELEVRTILIDDELNNKSLLEKDINKSTDVNVKKGLYSHLSVSNKKISDLEGEIKNIQQLIKSLQN